MSDKARCLECSSVFGDEKVVLNDDGQWGCPVCGSISIERILGAYDYESTDVKYEEGPHD